MSVEQAKEVKVKVTGGANARHPVSVTTSLSIGAFPSFNLCYPPGNKEAITSAMDMTSKEIFKRLQRSQENTFKTKEEKIKIRLKGPEGYGKLTFKGSVSCPIYTFNSSGLYASETIMARYASLNAVDLSIYKISNNYFSVGNPASKKANVSKLNKAILAIFTYLVDEAETEKPTEPTMKKSVEFTKKVNNDQKQYIKKLFENSKNMGWDGLYKKIGTSAWDSLKSRIITILQSNTGGFLNVILQLAEEFQCVYVPGSNGEDPGQLVNKLKLEENTRPIHLKPINIHAALGSRGMYPPGTVTLVSPQFKKNYFKNNPPDRLYYVYPEDASKDLGSTIQIPGPPWLSGDSYALIQPVKDGENKKKKGQSFSKKRVKQQTAEDKVDKKTKDIKEIIEQWAKASYWWQVLGQTGCTLTCEFGNYEVGKTYVVYNAKGQRLFTGLLYSVMHNISASEGTSMAQSILNFSHVRMGTAKIPGL